MLLEWEGELEEAGSVSRIFSIGAKHHTILLYMVWLERVAFIKFINFSDF